VHQVERSRLRFLNVSQAPQKISSTIAATSIVVSSPLLIPKLRRFMTISQTPKNTSSAIAATLIVVSNPLLIPKLRRFMTIIALLLSETVPAHATQNAPDAEWICCLRVGFREHSHAGRITEPYSPDEPPHYDPLIKRRNSGWLGMVRRSAL
jgi:hypothetical protein